MNGGNGYEDWSFMLLYVIVLLSWFEVEVVVVVAEGKYGSWPSE